MSNHKKNHSGIIRCPYCGSTNVIAGPFELYCLDCEESFNFGETLRKATSFLSKNAVKVGKVVSKLGGSLGDFVSSSGGKTLLDILSRIGI